MTCWYSPGDLLSISFPGTAGKNSLFLFVTIRYARIVVTFLFFADFVSRTVLLVTHIANLQIWEVEKLAALPTLASLSPTNVSCHRLPPHYAGTVPQMFYLGGLYTWSTLRAYDYGHASRPRHSNCRNSTFSLLREAQSPQLDPAAGASSAQRTAERNWSHRTTTLPVQWQSHATILVSMSKIHPGESSMMIDLATCGVTPQPRKYPTETIRVVTTT